MRPFWLVLVSTLCLIAPMASATSTGILDTHIGVCNPRLIGATQNDTTLSSAIASSATPDCTGNIVLLMNPGTWAIANTLTIPDRMAIDIPQGALLSVNGGQTLTLDCAKIRAGHYQIFAGDGDVVCTGSPVTGIPVDWFGTVGDGITDDLAALEAAETAAEGSGSFLTTAAGRAYAFDGQFDLDVSLRCGEGASFVPLGTAGPATPWQRTISAVTASDVTIAGCTIDSDTTTAGLWFGACTRCRAEHNTITDSIDRGIIISGATDMVAAYNVITNIDYGSAGGADGIFIENSTRVTAIGNRISDFERGGIVADLSGANRNHDVSALYNLINNGHDSDDQADQYNIGLHAEGTNGYRAIGNIIWDIGGNAGQTLTVPRGITLGSSDDTESTYIIRDNVINFGDGSVENGYCMVISGTSNYKTVISSGNHFSYCSIGTGIGAAIAAYSSINDHFDHLTYSAATHGAWLLDTAGNFDLTIDSPTLTNITKTHADAQDVNLVADGTGTGTFTIHNAHVGLKTGGTAADIAVLNITDSIIEFGTSTTYGTMDASEIRVANTKITPTAGRSDLTLFRAAAGETVDAQFANIEWDGVDSVLGGDGTMRAHFYNSRFVNGSTVNIDCSGTSDCQIFFDHDYFEEYTADGAIQMNFTAAPTNDRLYVRNCDFQHTSDVTPIQEWTDNPSLTIMSGNRYTATVLHDMTDNFLVTDRQGVAFANLGSATNGSEVYCPDCTDQSSPCTGSGNGALAKRLNGAWECD